MNNTMDNTKDTTSFREDSFHNSRVFIGPDNNAFIKNQHDLVYIYRNYVTAPNVKQWELDYLEKMKWINEGEDLTQKHLILESVKIAKPNESLWKRTILIKGMEAKLLAPWNFMEITQGTKTV